MTKQKRVVCHQNLTEFAAGVLARCKNGPRALFKIIEERPGSHLEAKWADVPADGQNYAKILKHYPERLWGVYDNRVKVTDLVADMGYKEA